MNKEFSYPDAQTQGWPGDWIDSGKRLVCLAACDALASTAAGACSGICSGAEVAVCLAAAAAGDNECKKHC